MASRGDFGVGKRLPFGRGARAFAEGGRARNPLARLRIMTPQGAAREPVERCMRPKLAVLHTALGVLFAGSTAGAAPVVATVPVAAVAADSALAFRPLQDGTDRFSVSALTRTYERDLTIWT